MVNETNSSSSSETDDDSQVPRIFFLALIMLTSCVVSFFLLYAVFQSRKIRHSVQSITIINLVIVCLSDCFLNMSLVMGSLASTNDWVFDGTVCKWHAFVMNLVLTETVLLLTVLACDRFLAVRFLQKYDSMISPARLGFIIVFTWIQSLAFSIPFLFNTVKMTFRPKLHICSVSDETPLAFICIASVLCFLAPAVIILIMFILVCRLNCKGQHEVKTIVTQNHYTDQWMEEPRLYKEMVTVKYVGVLCLMWLILEIPYVITTYVQQYRYSSELVFSIDYPWGVDVSFIWMRFSFSAVFPCITFIWKKDLWQFCKECVICHKSNSVLDIQGKVNPASKKTPIKELPSTKSKDRDHSKTEIPHLLTFNVPVLFATADGIHIQSPHCDPFDPDFDFKEHALKGRQLDIGEPNDANCECELPGDTSDYEFDSVSEECNSSTLPLSAHHIQGELETSSLPDLQKEMQNKQKVCTNVDDFADSGLELSGTTGSSRGKEIQRFVIGSQQYDKTTVSSDGAYKIIQSTLPQQDASCPPSNETDLNVGGDINQQNCYNSLNVKDSSALEHNSPSTLPKVHGRLKPLGQIKKPKVGKPGQPKKRTTMKLGSYKDKGACNEVRKKEIDCDQTEIKEKGPVGNCSKPQEQEIVKCSKEGRGKGHKRTQTSDSEKALLGSNSSVEMNTMKMQSSEPATTDKPITDASVVKQSNERFG